MLMPFHNNIHLLQKRSELSFRELTAGVSVGNVGTTTGRPSSYNCSTRAHNSDIHALQRHDPAWMELWPFWDWKSQPNHTERQTLSSAGLALLRQWDRLVEKDGLFYRPIFHPDGAEEGLQLLLYSCCCVKKRRYWPRHTRTMAIKAWKGPCHF